MRRPPSCLRTPDAAKADPENPADQRGIPQPAPFSSPASIAGGHGQVARFKEFTEHIGQRLARTDPAKQLRIIQSAVFQIPLATGVQYRYVRGQCFSLRCRKSPLTGFHEYQRKFHTQLLTRPSQDCEILILCRSDDYRWNIRRPCLQMLQHLFPADIFGPSSQLDCQCQIRTSVRLGHQHKRVSPRIKRTGCSLQCLPQHEVLREWIAGNDDVVAGRGCDRD